MTKFSTEAAEAWDAATVPRSCATCIHSCVARSAMPCAQCYGFVLHEPRPEPSAAINVPPYSYKAGDVVTMQFEPSFTPTPPFDARWLLPPRTYIHLGPVLSPEFSIRLNQALDNGDDA